MMNTNKKTPKLRFKGFVDDWGQRKLGSIGSTYTGLSDKTKEDFGHGEAQYITYLNIFLNIVSDITMTDKVEIDTTQNEVKYGDVLFTTSSETPEEVGMSSVWMGDSPNTYLNSFCFGFRPNQKINPYFLGYSLRAPYMRDKIKILAQGISRYNISKNKVMELEISLPNNEEQKLLGTFLQRIDLIITLHQRKLEHLNLKKKALLQKLFPKNGDRYPELRFPGFTDAWEQRKLSEVVTINPKTELPDEFKYVDLESVVGTNLLGFKVIKKENAPSRAQRLASYGDVFYQTVRPYQRNNYLFENVDKDVVFSTGYAQLRSKLDSYFLLTLVQNDNFVKVVLDNCTGTSYPAINGSELGKITVQIPSNEVEANQIGKVFRGIDKSITLHQRKLDNLKLKKKALLQKLFPKNGDRYPELRFPGFTDAWEQRKLGDIATFSKGNGYSKSDLAPSGEPIILYGRLYTNYETTIRNVDTFVELKDKSVISQGGEVIVPASGETAEDISRASVVKNQGIIIGGDLNVIKVNHLLNPTFLALTISNGEQQKELSKRAQGKSVVHLHNSDLQEVNLTFPLLNEQKEISSLFEKMDSVITLHQQEPFLCGNSINGGVELC